MIRGVEKGRYLVFTSPDIRAGWYAQRYVPWLYNAVMRRLNRRLTSILRKAQATQRA